MSRFEILALLSRVSPNLTVPELARASEELEFHRHAFRAALRTQLNRLHRWGLVRRQFRRWSYSPQSGFGRWHYSISQKGKDRLAWARAQGKL